MIKYIIAYFILFLIFYANFSFGNAEWDMTAWNDIQRGNFSIWMIIIGVSLTIIYGVRRADILW